MKKVNWPWALLGLAMAVDPLAAETYQIDPVHSGITFRVAHMVISKVTGRFDKFQGIIEHEQGKPKTWSVETAIEISSINTNVADRDKHLKSADFLDMEKYPQITFKSRKATNIRGKKFRLLGDLAIHGVTKPVALDVDFGGVVKDPWGNQRLGATAAVKINRKDFGLTWNKVLDTGGLLVGEDIEIILEIEGILKKA